MTISVPLVIGQVRIWLAAAAPAGSSPWTPPVIITNGPDVDACRM